MIPKFGLKDSNDGAITYKAGSETDPDEYDDLTVVSDEENVFIKWYNVDEQIYQTNS